MKSVNLCLDENCLSSASSFHPMKNFSWFGLVLLSSCVPQKSCHVSPWCATWSHTWSTLWVYFTLEKIIFLMNILSCEQKKKKKKKFTQNKILEILGLKSEFIYFSLLLKIIIDLCLKLISM